MLKLFRKIRQSLLSENKVSKYLIYAVGEIILVVIGILIALQINNWNDDNKKDKLKQEFVNSLIVDLTKDSIQLNRNIVLNESRLNQINKLLDSIANGHYTTLEQFMRTAQRQSGLLILNNTYNTNSFNLLIASGNIDLFDEKMRTELMELNRLQSSENSINKSNVNQLLTLIGEANRKYPTSTIPFRPNKTSQLLWDNVPLNEIPRDLTNFLSREQFVTQTYINLSRNVLLQTELVLDILHK